MLVLTIFFIAMAAALAALIMAGSAQLIRITRNEHESIVIRQLTDSGKAWALAHPHPQPASPVTLSCASLLPEDITGEVQITYDSEIPSEFEVTAVIRLQQREVSQTTWFPVSP